MGLGIGTGRLSVWSSSETLLVSARVRLEGLGRIEGLGGLVLGRGFGLVKGSIGWDLTEEMTSWSCSVVALLSWWSDFSSQLKAAKSSWRYLLDVSEDVSVNPSKTFSWSSFKRTKV